MFNLITEQPNVTALISAQSVVFFFERSEIIFLSKIHTLVYFNTSNKYSSLTFNESNLPSPLFKLLRI